VQGRRRRPVERRHPARRQRPASPPALARDDRPTRPRDRLSRRAEDPERHRLRLQPDGPLQPPGAAGPHVRGRRLRRGRGGIPVLPEHRPAAAHRAAGRRGLPSVDALDAGGVTVADFERVFRWNQVAVEAGRPLRGGRAYAEVAVAFIHPPADPGTLGPDSKTHERLLFGIDYTFASQVRVIAEYMRLGEGRPGGELLTLNDEQGFFEGRRSLPTRTTPTSRSPGPWAEASRPRSRSSACSTTRRRPQPVGLLRPAPERPAGRVGLRLPRRRREHVLERRPGSLRRGQALLLTCRAAPRRYALASLL
jgi:hypothetical protein